jgi:phospholipid transport system substrate-binding protein
MLKQIIVMVWLLFFASTALAASPMAAVQTTVDQVLSILRESDSVEKKIIDGKFERIKEVVDDAFDYEVLSRITLGRGWRQLNDLQKEQFAALYSELIERTYRNYISSYSNEDVIYVKETLLTEAGSRIPKAEVETQVMARQGPVLVLYRLYEKNGKWLVYDIHGEGISLAQNFRTQFEEILHRSGVEGLLESLRGKVASLRDGVEVAN